jgi:sec-independent protein translocase protein TatB
MHFGDSIFIFLLALVLFGPKKLPEIGRTIGKLLAEFRRASNEFKFQIQDELRNMEEDERRKKLADQQAQKASESSPVAEIAAPSTTPTILPPSTGTPVSTGTPYATPVNEAETMIEPSAAEVTVEPAVPTQAGASAIDFAHDAPAHLDLTTHSNGAHAPAADAEPVESSVASDQPSDVPSESLHHG